MALLPNQVSYCKVWMTLSFHGRVLVGQGEHGDFGKLCERRVLSEWRKHCRFGYYGDQRCQHSHGKPRVDDGKVLQGVDGAQEHEDTLL